MNQRLAVRALVKKDERILLLRRASGRQSILGKYELPGGRVEYDEQPEDALIRHLNEATGLALQTIQLSDVLTYIDHDNRDIQYGIILYFASPTSAGIDVNISTNYDYYMWCKPSSIHEDELTDLSKLLLNIQNKKSLLYISNRVNSENNKPTAGQLIIYSDGGSRGNPGPSAAGYVIVDIRGELVDEGGSYIGITTNNQAEYHGILLGLEKARKLGAVSVEFRLDSLLVANQLNGTYVIRNRELWPVHERIRALMAQFEKVTFRHVKREFNQRADAMVNKILDTHTKEKV